MSTGIAFPTAPEQQMLYDINHARMNPAWAANLVTSNLSPDITATLNHYGVDPNQVKQDIANTSPQQPLTWNPALGGTSQQQSQDENTMQTQSHTGANGSSLDNRLDQAGYTNRVSYGENTFASAQSVSEAFQAFMIDWGVSDLGHRKNILQPGVSSDQSYHDAGVGVVQSTGSQVGPQIDTVDFGRQANAQPNLLGVVFNDPNNTFQAGEGEGGVTISATNLQSGQTSNTQTWDAGGYQMPLLAGTYQVTAKNGSQVLGSQQVTISDQNVEVDFNTNTPYVAPPSAPAPVQAAAPVTPQVKAPTPTPAPAPTPTPAPAPTPTPPPAPAPTVTPTPQATPQNTPPVTAPSGSQPDLGTAVTWKWRSFEPPVAS